MLSGMIKTKADLGRTILLNVFTGTNHGYLDYPIRLAIYSAIETV